MLRFTFEYTRELLEVLNLDLDSKHTTGPKAFTCWLIADMTSLIKDPLQRQHYLSCLSNGKGTPFNTNIYMISMN